MEEFMNIIVQAGGRGSRLRHLTWNKPKCLVSIEGQPLLYHLFDSMQGYTFQIISDYGYDQLATYLRINLPSCPYELVKTHGIGTLSGIRSCIESCISSSVMILWSDLILPGKPDIVNATKPIVFITDSFHCRWSIDNHGLLVEKGSSIQGVPGIFYFPDKSVLQDVPESGEFVKWLASSGIDYEVRIIENLSELGDFATIQSLQNKSVVTRFFNDVKIQDNIVVKQVKDQKYSHLIQNEIDWYKSISNYSFDRVPKLLAERPFTIQKICGQHPFHMQDLTRREKRAVLADIIDSLSDLHQKDTMASSTDDIIKVYYDKTIQRVESVKDLIPNVKNKTFTVNGKKCRNYLHENNLSELLAIVTSITPATFNPIHGDPTFSNTLIDKYLRAIFIDPRGYFAKQGVFGDPWYDFSKLYYSVIGSYDAFNRRKFKLFIDSQTVEVLIDPCFYEEEGLEVFNHYFADDLRRIEIIHGLIWIALSGYAKDDIDSVIGSYFMGMFYLEQGLSS